jgi:hypothetical protein
MNMFNLFTKKSIYKVVVSNDSDELKTLMLEPWGEDYVMKPKDEFEIIEEDVEDVYFHIVYSDYIAVYVEGTGNSYPRVYQNGEELECGHNRELLEN